MSLLAMPMLVVNMGAEMMFILEQRLKAQSISADKSGKVLNDVAGTMFNKAWIEQLFTPQAVHSVVAVRKIFDRLAHSSIMRLSETSMDKLFDLMMMGFKYQLLCAIHLDSMLQVTRLHLAQLRVMLSSLPESNASLSLVAAVDKLAQETYSGLTVGAQHLLRQTLLQFYKDKRVKVSLFLQEGIQSNAGRLILHSPASNYVGSVTYYNDAGVVEKQERHKLKALDLDPMEYFIHPVPLGTNLYNKERSKVVPPPRKGDALAAPVRPEDELGHAGEGKAQYAYAEDLRHAGGSAGARQELNLLSALLSVKTQADNFKLQLFEMDDSGFGKQLAPGEVPSVKFEGGNAYKAGMMAQLKLDDGVQGGGGRGKPATDEEDLLDLLDGA